MALVVADTSALYALASANDEFHVAATEAYKRLLREEHDLWLTSYVLVELGALIQRRLGFEVLRAFYEAVETTFQTFWVDGPLHTEAWRELARRDGKGLSLVDWTVFLVARRLSATIFTYDSGFVVEGAAVFQGEGA